MKIYILTYYKIIFVLLLVLVVAPSEARKFDDSKIEHIDYPGWFNENAFNDLAEITNESIANAKKGLFVLFTTEGCSYCELFIRKSLGDSGIASIVKSNFESVGLEIFDDAEMRTPGGETKSVKQFSEDEKVQFSPTILFYGEKGKRILRLTGYQSPERFRKILDYVIHEHYKLTSFKNYLLAEKTTKTVVRKVGPEKTPLRDNPIFGKPPYLLDRSHFPASNPLLVIFEKTGCPVCENFHTDVLSQNDVLKTLKLFEVVRFNARDDKTIILTPDGKKTTPAEWYENNDFTQAPAMLFFDEYGNKVLMTDTMVLHQRMMNSLNYVLEKANKKGWSYQKFARSKAIERSQKNQ